LESTDDDTNTFACLILSANAFSVSDGTTLLIITVVLLALSAVIAGAETAFFSLTQRDVNFLKTKNSISARQVVALLEQPKILLATMLVANNFINIAIIISTNIFVNHLFPDVGGYWAFLINVVCVTFFLVLFGEVLPKVYATQHNLRLAIFSAPYIKLLYSIFLPVSKILVNTAGFVEKKVGKSDPTQVSNADFETAIELTVGHSATKEEVNIFKGIIKFGKITARQIMRTRLDVCCVDWEWDFAKVKSYCLDAGYSRLPVYNDDLDHVSGMIHTKDFLPHLNEPGYDWHQLVRQAYFVHESKMIEDLLKEFQQKRIHLAVVVDEFGGTSGIITLEDIMEEIIGDIRDEFDEEDLNYKKLDDKNYQFEGKTAINDFCKIIGEPPSRFEKARGESDSLAGLILEIYGRFPGVNEKIRFENFDFTILALDRMRIQRVKVTINTPNSPREN
jgi:putative hemolysin